MTRQQYSAAKSMRTGAALESEESSIVQPSANHKLILLLRMEYLNSFAFLFLKADDIFVIFPPKAGTLSSLSLSLVFRPEKEDLLLLSGVCDLSDESFGH